MTASFSTAFEESSRAHAGRVATLDAAGGPVSFENLFYTMMAFAEALQDRGVGPGDLVAVHVTDAIAGSALRLALLRIGATAMGRCPPEGGEGYRPDWHLITEGTAATGGRDIAVGRSWVRSPQRWVPVTAGGAMIRSTSGTTGVPKLRRITDEGLLARITRGSDWRGRPEGAVFIGYATPSGPFFNHMGRALLGGVVQVHPRDDDAASLALMEAAGVTAAFLSPWNFRRMVAAAEAGAMRSRSLRRIMVGGGEVAPDLAARAEALFGAEVVLGYGSSETGSIAHTRPALHPDVPGYVGPVYDDMAFRLCAEDGSPADPATGGELWLQVPEPIRLHDFPSGRPLADAEGWVATGDLCRILPDGGLQFLGRRSELLNIGGTKRAPHLFEALARGFPGVADVAAFRLPEPGGGDRLGMAVVPGPGFDATALAAHLTGHLGARCPFDMVVRDAIPVTPAGKTDRRRLSDEHVSQSSESVAPG